MRKFKFTVPLETADLPAHCDFMDWLQRLHDGGICAEVYRNSSIDTAEILQRAYPQASVFVLDINHTDTYLIPAVENMYETMEEITKAIQQNSPRNVVCIERTTRS